MLVLVDDEITENLIEISGHSTAKTLKGLANDIKEILPEYGIDMGDAFKLDSNESICISNNDGLFFRCEPVDFITGEKFYFVVKIVKNIRREK